MVTDDDSNELYASYGVMGGWVSWNCAPGDETNIGSDLCNLKATFRFFTTWHSLDLTPSRPLMPRDSALPQTPMRDIGPNATEPPMVLLLTHQLLLVLKRKFRPKLLRVSVPLATRSEFTVKLRKIFLEVSWLWKHYQKENNIQDANWYDVLQEAKSLDKA